LFLPGSGTLAGGQEITCAATRTVTSSADSGAASLRQAIADVCAGGTVNFSLSYPATITLTSGVALTLTKDVTITGPGADKVAVSGNAATRVFVVDRYVSVSIDGLTIRDGRTGGDGGGILVLDSGQLSMINSTFTANQANNGGALSVERSSPGLINVTFSGNSATNRGGAMYSVAYDNSCCTYLRNVIFSGNSAALGGAMYNYGNGGSNSPSLENVTFSGNSASQGGAMFNYGTSGGVSSPSLINVTFVGNSATSRGGAMYNNGGGGSSSPSLVNVILWGNTATTAGAQLFNVSAAPIISFTLVPSSTADIAVSSSTITWGPGNITSGGDALLGALGDYGGDTQTMPLLPGSPAIDAGDATACPDTDQRGATRPVGDGCDMGAFERQGFTLSKGTGDSQSAAWGMAFGAPITVAVSSTFTEPVDGGQVTFAGPLSGAGTAPITGTATITGGVAIFTPTANSTAGSYNVTGSAAGASPAISFGLTNTQRASAMTLVAAPNPSIIRQAVTFTSTVTDSVGSALPTGVVTFTVNGAEVAATLANGVATYVTDTLAAAGHVITATYGGDAGFTGSTDNLTQVVNRAATSTALAGAPNPSVYGQAVTYTATVTATAPGVGLPTGIVTFMDGTTALGTGTLDESGVATYTTSSLISGPPGTPGQPHPITAAYGGDGSFAGSTSAAVDQVVNQAATTTTLVSSRNPSTYGDNIVFTATVSVQTPGAASMTGEVVIFKDGATTLGTGTLDAGGVATYTTSLLSVGVYSMTADFAGTSNLLGSTSTEVAQLIAKAAQTITFDTIADKQISAAPFTVTATASSRLTVTFTSGTPAVCTVSESTVSLVNNGACTIYATQPGDHNYLAATPVGRSFNVVGKHGTATSLAT
ncbi:MAG: Ig-like domain repeat protein, partial [Caldilinea sp.]|nr:Ig-like domain repeat protein [Caldilinea sp.]